MTTASAERIFPVAADIFGVRLPMPPPLEWINAYFLKDGNGWAIVDTGYNTPESRAVLDDIIANHLDGLPVTRVIVTHYHPDHVGQAGYLCNRFACPLNMTQTEWLLARWLSTDQSPSYRQVIADYYRRAGTPNDVYGMITEKGNSFLRTADEVPATYHRMTQGDLLMIGDRQWRVMIGRGHAPEMVLLYDSQGKILISADQIVARITPNISIWAFDTEANPLRDFLVTSQDFIDTVPNDVTILPGHGRPFQDFHSRVVTFAPHHENRLNKLYGGLGTEAKTLHEAMKALFTRDLTARDYVFALGETHAHLNYLRAEKRAVCEKDLWRMA